MALETTGTSQPQNGGDHVTVEKIGGEETEASGSSLIIPISSSSANDDNLFIEIFPEEMADTPAPTLLQVLKDENADLNVWADAGLQYMQQKLSRQSLTILEEACDLPVSDKNQRVRILAATGIAHLAASATTAGSGGLKRGPAGSDPKDELRQQADQKFTQAGKVDTFFPMTWMGRGMLNLSAGRLDQARFFFDTTLKQCGPVMPALLGMAAVMFGEGNYKESLKHYETAIRKYPVKSGAPARVGFGLCCYRLGQIDRSKAAFARALALDPENVEAMVGAAILDMAGLDETAKDFSARTEKAIKMMSMANLLNHSNAMVQNHLANHYFWKWTPVTGTVEVTQGSTLVKGSQPIPLDPGERIRIGTKFESTVVEDVTLDDDDDSTNFRMHEAWKESSTVGLKVWKKDYDRVIALAKGAYSSTTVAEIQAESLFFLARVYHVREDHDNAHKFYEKACSLAPNLTPARFGLAQILIVKDDYKQAMGHLNKVLAASASATDALSLLGLLEVRAGKDIEEGLARLRKAVELDPLNPDLVVMEALALQQHESNYGKALERYQKAVDLMKRKRTKVPYEIYTNSGVLCHQTKRFDEASDMYQQALASLENFSTACVASLDNLGVDGGRIRHPDNSMFFDYVDSKLKIEPVDIDGKSVMKILDVSETDLPSLAISVGDHIKLKDDFFSVIESVTVKDGSVILTTKDSFDPMETAEENKDPMETETPEKSKESLSVFVKRENEILKIPAATTIAFNIARLHEVTGRTMAAIELHKAIAKRNPAYVNSYLRLACIAVDCGSLSECSQWLKIAAASAPGNPEVLALIGNLHLSLCDWAPAQTVFSSLLEKKISSVEAYASLSLGNIYFANLHVNEEKYARHLQHASDFYRRILTKDAANAYAANGLGTVLAERGEIFKAKEVFNRVREVSGDTIADALLNLGHIYLAQKKHPEALQMYTSYMKRAEDGTTPVTSKSREDDVVDVLMYIAFAYFDWARHTELFNDANAAPADGRYRQAMEHLELAIGKHTKKEVVLKYNLCMTKLQAGNCQLQKLTRNIQRTVEDVEEALQGLKESQATVEEILSEKNQGNKVNIPTSTLQDFLKHCKANIASAESHLDDEKTRAEEASAERKIRQLAAEAAMKEETLKQAILEEEKTKKQEERDQKADAKMRQVDELRAGWEQEQDSKQVAKDKKSKKPSGSVDPELDVEEVGEPEAGHGLFDDSDEDGSDAEQGAKEGKSKPADSASKATTNADLFGDSDEDDDDGEKADKAKGPVKAQASNKDPFADSDDDDDEDEKPGDSSAPAEAKANSKDPFGDSDDDDDDDINASKDATKEAGTGSGQTEEKKATSAELFGDSDEGESDEELVRADTKRKGAEAEETQEKQPQKKRKVLEDDEED